MESGTTLTSALLAWYDSNGRDLPWRGSSDPYAVLVSEFMLQQTTVSAVYPYFRKWMKKYPSIEALAAAGEGELMRDWEGLGYYSRVRNLHSAAREIVRRYGGAIPEDPGRLKKLPGIGDYTAAAVASIAFGLRVPALDANNLRVWSRLLTSSDRKRIARVLTRVLPENRPGDFNQALMDLGATVCTPGDPRCPACPISPWCRALRSGKVTEYPPRKARPDPERVEAAIGIIVEGDKVLVQRRPESGLLAGLWEFPGGRIGCAKCGVRGAEKQKRRRETRDSKNLMGDPGLETPEEAVVREVREETGLRAQVCGKLGVFTHAYTRFRVRLHVFLCRRKAGRLNHPQAKWVTLEELEKLPMPSANRRIVKALEKHLDALTR